MGFSIIQYYITYQILYERWYLIKTFDVKKIYKEIELTISL